MRTILIPIFCVFTLIALVPAVQAELATSTQMDQVATNWLAQKIAQNGVWAGSHSPTIESVDEIIAEGAVVARCYQINPDGFVVVPALMEVGPVKGFSETGHLNVNDADGPVELLRDVLAAHAEEFTNRYGSLDIPQSKNPSTLLFEPANRDRWEVYTMDERAFQSSKAMTSGGRSEQYGPLLTSRWHQSEPFNTYCPPETPVGCVATGAAQLMQYWQWPDEGVGSSGYYWDGDGGPTEYLSAEYWDSYDWDNMVDYCPYPACSTVEADSAVAELNYEVAVAFEMDFGVDGSGLTWSEIVGIAMPAMVNHFLYKDGWDAEYRNQGYTSTTWFNMIQAELNEDRPMLYAMRGHLVVCDGWYIDDTGSNYYHMNYGWGGDHNLFYLIDNIYQPADPPGTYLEEELIRYLEPDKSVMFSTADRVGWVPFDAYFEGASEYAADAYAWDFGDGGTGENDTCTHTYTEPGIYDIGLDVTVGVDEYSRTKEQYVIALADSLTGDTTYADPEDWNEITIYASNTIALDEINIPVEFGGDIEVDAYTLTWSTDGCRTSGFDFQERTHFNPGGDQMTIRLANTGSSTDLPAGSGPVLKIQFEISSTPTLNDTTYFQVEGYGSRLPYFGGPMIAGTYTPILSAGIVHYSDCCQGIRGNIDNDPLQTIDIADLVYLVTWMFGEGPEPPCMKEANVDGDIWGTTDIADLVYLVTYMFSEGPEPAICW